MDIRNRMVDVDSLRRHACQDLLKLLLQSKPGWQEKLWEEKDDYPDICNKVWNYGVDSLSVDEMDETAIYDILSKYYNSRDKQRSIASVNKPTFKALRQLKDERNISAHSHGNEKADELYTRALVSLYDIKGFVKTVAKFEQGIKEWDRLDFSTKYTHEADKLMDLIDDERITFVQQRKAIMRDIQRFKESGDPENTWIEILQFYMNRWKIGHDPEQYFMFMRLASDAGIKNAHEPALAAAIYNKDWEEYDRRLPLVYHDCYLLREDWGSAKEKALELKTIVDMMNEYISANIAESAGFKEIIADLSKNGVKINKAENGLYELINA